MSELIVNCDRCGLQFAPGVQVGPNSHFTVQNVKANCPSCRALVTVPGFAISSDAAGNVSVRFLRQAYDIIASSVVSPEDRRELGRILREAVEEGTRAAQNPDALVERIRRDAPSLAPLAELIASPLTANVAAIIGVVLALIAMMGERPDSSGTARETVVNTIVREFEAARAQSASGQSDDVGRNSRCWCGSGKKFKKCHGAPTAR